MKAVIAGATFVALFAMGGSGAALASGNCGINSNAPCPPPEKLSVKEPADKGQNSNQPTAQQAGDPPARAEVKAKASEETAAKATLGGVSASDLKVKPKPPKSSSKEPANSIP